MLLTHKNTFLENLQYLSLIYKDILYNHSLYILKESFNTCLKMRKFVSF